MNYIENEDVNYHGSNDLIFENPQVRDIQYNDGTITYSVSFNYVDKEAVTRLSTFNVVFNSDEDLFVALR